MLLLVTLGHCHSVALREDALCTTRPNAIDHLIVGDSHRRVVSYLSLLDHIGYLGRAGTSHINLVGHVSGKLEWLRRLSQILLIVSL